MCKVPVVGWLWRSLLDVAASDYATMHDRLLDYRRLVGTTSSRG